MTPYRILSTSTLKTSFSIGLFLFLFTACGGGEEEKKDKEEEEAAADTSRTEEKGSQEQESGSAQKRSAVLPTTLQVASSFKKAGLPYQEGVTLSVDKVDDLVDPARKKLVFGAYSADLAYLVLNEKGDQALKTMRSLMKLSKDLNISSVFNTEEIADRFRSNIDERDSLIQLIIEVQERFDTYVAKNRNRKLRTIAYAGGWVEAIHIAARSDLSDKEQLHLEVEEQMTVLEKLLTAIERDVGEGEGVMADLLKELKSIHRIYEENAPEPGEKLSDQTMEKMKKKALKARAIISQEAP